jgi:hypothetical protein
MESTTSKRLFLPHARSLSSDPTVIVYGGPARRPKQTTHMASSCAAAEIRPRMVGIDASERSRDALALAARLVQPGQRLLLTHVRARAEYEEVQLGCCVDEHGRGISVEQLPIGGDAVRGDRRTTPASSWTSSRLTSPRLHLVERWFAEVTSRYLRRGTHGSVRDLHADIRAWI